MRASRRSASPRTRFGSYPVEEDDFAGGFQHTGKLVESRFGIRHRVDDTLGDHDVEGSAGEIEPLGIHHGELLNVLQPSFEDAPARLSQHLL